MTNQAVTAGAAGAIYSVSVERILDEGWIRALEVTPLATHRYYIQPARTTFTLELADQAALLGLLNRLHNLGLTVLSVARSAPHTGQTLPILGDEEETKSC